MRRWPRIGGALLLSSAITKSRGLCERELVLSQLQKVFKGFTPMKVSRRLACKQALPGENNLIAWLKISEREWLAHSLLKSANQHYASPGKQIFKLYMGRKCSGGGRSYFPYILLNEFQTMFLQVARIDQYSRKQSSQNINGLAMHVKAGHKLVEQPSQNANSPAIICNLE